VQRPFTSSVDTLEEHLNTYSSDEVCSPVHDV
jgi:hypothetical protein